MNKTANLFFRYLILIAVAVPNLYIFYKVFTPLTIYPVYFLIKFFADAALSGSTIFFSNSAIEIAGACVAGSAYYLLTILNLSTPDIKLKKRIYLLLTSYAVFLFLNISRILFLSFLLYSNFPYFDATHKILWYSLSTIFVVAIWFSEVKFFKIKSMPAYSDLKFLYNKSLFKNAV